MEDTLTLTAEATGQPRMRDRWLTLGVGLFIFIVLFAIWPYQHWIDAHRASVLVGWAKILPVGTGEWEFCYIVPVIVGFLVYRQREVLSRLPIAGDWNGSALILLGAVFYWLGYKVDTGYLGYAALQTMLAGLILLLAGRAWWRALLFPWLFLIFAWPLFPLDYLLAARLKIPTAQAATAILQLLGVPTERDGSALLSAADAARHLPLGAKFRLEVSDSCSGMRSLYSLIMMSVLYGELALKRPMPKFLLFISAVPLSIIGNVFRLLLLAFGSLWFGQEFAIGHQQGDHLEESTYHLLCGFALFGVALAGMFALASVLEGRQWLRLKALKATAPIPSHVLETQAPSATATPVKAAAAIGLSFTALLLCMLTPKKVDLATPGVKAELPAVVGDFTSIQDGMTAKERQNFDEGVQLDRRHYRNPEGLQIMGTLVLSGELKKTLHDPARCLPDAGWIITDIDEVTLKLADGRVRTASVMHVFKDEMREGHPLRHRGLNLFWYEGSDGVSTPSYVHSNYLNYRDAIFRNLNHRWGQVAFFLDRLELATENANPMADIIGVEQLKDFVRKCAPQFLTSDK